MALQENNRLKNDIPECLKHHNINVQVIPEVNKENIVSYNSQQNSDESSAADKIRSFLGKDLSQKAFYFITGKVKQPPKEALNFSDKDSNGDISSREKEFDSMKSNSLEYEEESVIGSPLKIQAIANLSLKYPDTSTPITNGVHGNKANLVGHLSVRDARKLLSNFNQTSHNKSASMIVILCDGKDHSRTFLIGAHKSVVERKIMLKTFKVTSDKTKIAALEEPAVNSSARGYHLTSQYKVLDKNDGLGSMILEARWTDPYGSLKLRRLQSAEFHLIVNVASGCDQSAVFNQYCQLQKVRELVEGLITGELPQVLTKKPYDALKHLKELFAKIKLGGLGTTSGTADGTSITGMLSGTTKQLKIDPPVDSDFTDQLWHIISLCTDFSDMIQCLNATFCELRRGDLKVFVHKDNETTIAKLVRQSYSGMASFPSLTGRLPLRLVAEIGVEKIRKDYSAIFINNGLCVSGQWNSFFKALLPPTEDIIDMEELNIKILASQTNILDKLHHCLEIVSTVDSYTSHQDLSSIAKHVMNYYKGEALNTAHTFCIPITALQASPEIKKLSLSSVRREGIKNGQSTVDFLTAELPEGLSCPSLSSSVDPGDVSTIMGDSKEFFLFQTQEHILGLGSFSK